MSKNLIKILHLVSKILLIVFLFAFAVIMVGGGIAFENKNQFSSFLGQATQDIIKDPAGRAKISNTTNQRSRR